eukprot:4112439-Pyramimonas_sp.AAC.1
MTTERHFSERSSKWVTTLTRVWKNCIHAGQWLISIRSRARRLTPCTEKAWVANFCLESHVYELEWHEKCCSLRPCAGFSPTSSPH